MNTWGFVNSVAPCFLPRREALHWEASCREELRRGAPCREANRETLRVTAGKAAEKDTGKTAGKNCAVEAPCRGAPRREALRRGAPPGLFHAQSSPTESADHAGAVCFPTPRDENRSFPRSEYRPARRSETPPGAAKLRPAQRNSAPRSESPSDAQQKHAPRTTKNSARRATKARPAHNENSARRATKNVRFLRATNAHSAQKTPPRRAGLSLRAGRGLLNFSLDLVQIEVVFVLLRLFRLGGFVGDVAGGAAAQKGGADLRFQRVEYIGVLL